VQAIIIKTSYCLRFCRRSD